MSQAAQPTDTPTIEFFYDIGSPYSYLAAVRVDDVGAALGLPVVWKPFLLGAVFKATGNSPPANVPAKGAWMLRDLALQGAMHGVDIQLPASFPTNSLHAQRALLAADALGGADALKALTFAFYEAYWGRGLDVASPDVLRGATEDAGLDADAIAARMVTQPIKDALRANTDEAIARGAFGAPTLIVGDMLFFGSDRFDVLTHHVNSLR